MTPLETTWTRPAPKGKGKGKDKSQPVNDRLISCKRCKWSTRDSLRYNTTSNMIRHMLVQHEISQNSSPAGPLSLGTSFQSQEEVMKNLEKNLVNWVIGEDMAFSSIERPLFQKIINDIPGISMPFKSRNTLTSLISSEFELDRTRLIEELATSSQTVTLSLDGWTSNNDVSILAVIGHWLSGTSLIKKLFLSLLKLRGRKLERIWVQSF